MGPGALALLLVALAATCMAVPTPVSPPWQALHPAGLSPNADLGSAVVTFAVGDTLLVVTGAQNNRNQTGTVFVYQRPLTPANGSLRLSSVLEPSGLDVGANFGCAFGSAAVSNATALLFVGAQYDAGHAGTLWTYAVSAPPSTAEGEGRRATVTLQAVTARPPSASRFFGSSIAVSRDGGRIAVGAASGNTTGSVFVFAAPTVGGGGPRLRLTLRGITPGANFGQSVAVSNSGWVAAGLNHHAGSRGAVALFPPGSTHRIIVADPTLTHGAYLGSGVALFEEPAGLALITTAPWAVGGGTVVVFHMDRLGRMAVAQRLVAPKPGHHTFGSSLSVASSPLGKEVAGVLLGDWTLRGSAGWLGAYRWGTDRRLSLASDASPFAWKSGAYFGASSSAVALGGGQWAFAVGAFGAFGDQGAVVARVVAHPFGPVS